MSVHPLPPQVTVTCDECDRPCEFDEGFAFHFAADKVEQRVREDHSWRVVGGRYVCTYCQERKGQEVNE